MGIATPTPMKNNILYVLTNCMLLRQQLKNMSRNESFEIARAYGSSTRFTQRKFIENPVLTIGKPALMKIDIFLGDIFGLYRVGMQLSW